MIVCGHGNVDDFCEKHGMVIMEKHDGDIENYQGICPVLVTDKEMVEPEYYFLKGKMLARGVELVSIYHEDTKLKSEQMMYNTSRELSGRKKFGGRCKFGYHRVNGETVVHEKNFAVAKRIIGLSDMGYVLRQIQEDEFVRKLDGSKLSISTIQLIIKNREIYEKER